MQRFVKVLGVVKPGVLSFVRSRTCGRVSHVPVSPTFPGFRWEPIVGVGHECRRWAVSPSPHTSPSLGVPLFPLCHVMGLTASTLQVNCTVWLARDEVAA